MVLKLLALKAPYLRHRWQIDLQPAAGTLCTVPVLLAGCEPHWDALPELLVALAVNVDWNTDAGSLHDIAQVCTCARALVLCTLYADSLLRYMPLLACLL